MVLSGFHAGPLVAHGSEHPPTAAAGVYDHQHGHGEERQGPIESDSPGDLNFEAGHHHSPSGPAPQGPQPDLAYAGGKQIVFASEATLLRLGAPAPPLDPPR